MKMVLFPAVPAEWLAELQQAAPQAELVNIQDEAQVPAAIATADAFFGVLKPEMLRAAQNLRWVQTPIAGLEKYMFPELIAHPLTLTNMRGIFSDHIADHALTYILTFARRFHLHFREQLQARWRPELDQQVIHLADCTAGIIGLGGIGQALAKRCAACEMRVVAVDPRQKEPSPGVAELWDMHGLDRLLAESDFVICCAPHTPETEKLLGAAQFARMKPTAYLINISRGVIVDLAALTRALQARQIAGAGLDVFEIEPLPAAHPLWKMPNVVITPHTAGHSPHFERRRLEVLKDNLSCFARGQPLKNVVEKEKWY